MQAGPGQSGQGGEGPVTQAAGEVWFYHLSASPLEAALPQLLRRALAAGWRVLVRGGDPARLQWLDEKLWLGPPDEFLPHGLAGGPHDARQPVLLSAEAAGTAGSAAAANGAQCLMAVAGAAIAAGELAGWTRACLLFDGADPVALEAARGQWRQLTAAGAVAHYWAEEGGRWVKKASSAG